MGPGRREVVWSAQASAALDEAVAFVHQESPAAAVQLLESALEAAGSRSTLWDRGRQVPEVGSPATRELFEGGYRLMYEICDHEIGVVAFVHGARDFGGRE